MNGFKVSGDKQKIGEALDALSSLLPSRPNVSDVARITVKGERIGMGKAAALLDLVYALENAGREFADAGARI